MRDLVLGKLVTCELDGEVTYDRCTAICYLDGADIAAELVLLGLARDCRRYSDGRYEQAELHAAQQGATIGETYELHRVAGRAPYERSCGTSRES